jgi:hypothetical protein
MHQTIVCEICAEAEETVEPGEYNTADCVCEVRAEAKETVEPGEYNASDCVVCEVRTEAKKLLSPQNIMQQTVS